MTEINLKATLDEVEDIYNGIKDFVFRDERIRVGKGDTLTFTAYKGKRPTIHPNDRRKYVVTYISKEAPIEEGFKIIGFKQI